MKRKSESTGGLGESFEEKRSRFVGNDPDRIATQPPVEAQDSGGNDDIDDYISTVTEVEAALSAILGNSKDATRRLNNIDCRGALLHQIYAVLGKEKDKTFVDEQVEKLRTEGKIRLLHLALPPSRSAISHHRVGLLGGLALRPLPRLQALLLILVR
jgi:hypothetical protein